MALLLIRLGRPYSPKHSLLEGEEGGGGGGISCRVLDIVPTYLARTVGFNILTQIIISHAGSLRLAGGRWDGVGRVEIFHNGAWGTVCDDDWDMDDAQVVCRELGYPSAISAPHKAHFGEGTGEILLDEVNCRGNEPSIERCSHIGWNVHNCGHHEDASVICSSKFDYVVFLFFVFTSYVELQ